MSNDAGFSNLLDVVRLRDVGDSRAQNPRTLPAIFARARRFFKGTNSIAPERAHRIVLAAALAVATLLATAAAFGREILSFFNVGIDDFRIAGGLLALVIAFEMFRAHYGAFTQTLEERVEAEADVSSIAITPLAFPLLVGPAEMSIMITLSNGHPRATDKVLLVCVSLLATCLVAGTLWVAASLKRILGNTGINVATRLMALIVASVGVEFIMTGIGHRLAQCLPR